MWGTGFRLNPAQAALANGTSAHARDFDDGGGSGHAGVTVLPAAIAAAEVVGASGRELITATIAGYDIGFRALAAWRVRCAHRPRLAHDRHDGQPERRCCRAKCLGLDADRFTDALGIAGSFTGGIWAFKDDGAMTKRLHPGKAW